MEGDGVGQEELLESVLAKRKRKQLSGELENRTGFPQNPILDAALFLPVIITKICLVTNT